MLFIRNVCHIYVSDAEIAPSLLLMLMVTVLVAVVSIAFIFICRLISVSL